MGRIVLALTFIVLTVSAMAGCTSTGGALSSGDDGPAARVLNVGITANAPPLIYERNGKITGLEAELAKKFAAFIGRKIRFVEVEWVDQIPALLSGRTDIIMSGMTITDLRRMRINFTRPYLVTGQVSLVRRDEYNRFSRGLTDLLSPVVSIGTVKGTTGNFLVQQKIGRSNNLQFDNPQQAVNAVIDGKIDAFVYDMPMNFYFAALNEAKGIIPVPVPLSREYLAWGVRKEDTELLAEADRFLEDLRRKNQLQPLVQRWIPYYRNVADQ